MIIGFDGRYAEGDLVGVGKFIKNLVSGMARKGNTCIVFYSNKPKTQIAGSTCVILNSKNRYHFEQVLLPQALKKYKVDLYHATGNVGIPIFCPVPSVLTVHDIIPLEIKDYFSYTPFSFLSRLSYTSRLKTSLAKASFIATDSDFVRDEVIKKLKISPKKIQTIYLGSPVIIDSGKLPPSLIGKKYMLNHGGIDIRKNLERLVEAFEIVHRNNNEINLVITGDNKRIRAQLDKLVSKLNLEKCVIFIGYVNEETLGAIIKNAQLVCYPTLSEGFGFPILEAFGAGTPVISSNTSSIPEIAGKAALLVDPENVEEISNAIEKVLGNINLQKDMVKKGKAEYNRFSWEKCINEYLDLYNNTK
jgi:glycosyltransferase involved in cell wall biosynthesis